MVEQATVMTSGLAWISARMELSRGGSANNVRAMEGMRGLAVFLVFIVHYTTLVSPWLAGNQTLTLVASYFHAMGNVGVDLFFVLSGYLIYGAQLSRPQRFSRFMGRRIVRIYPAFLAVFAMYVVLSQLFPSENKIPGGAVQAGLYLLQNLLLLPGLFPIEPMITVAWSLSYEMFYYLVVPLFIAACRMRERSAAWRVSIIFTVGLLMAIYFALNGGPVRLLMFVAGMVLFEAQSGSARPAGGLVGLGALVLALVIAAMPGGPGLQTPKIVLIAAAFYVFCRAAMDLSGGWLGRAFSWTPMRWLGNMSYSYYLIHGLALKAGFMVLSLVAPPSLAGAWMFVAALLPMFGLTLVPGLLLFLWIERPYSLVPATRESLSAATQSS